MEAPYRFVGNLWLEEPVDRLSSQRLAQLRELEPYLRELEVRTQLAAPSPLQAGRQAYLQKFEELKACEPYLFNPSRRPEDLCHPSGDLNSRLAIHLHNPSFTVFDLSSTETIDESNPCIWLLLQSGITTDNTLMFDHLARRDIVDGLRKYPEKVIACHEKYTSWLRENMGAIVEVACGGVVRKRMQDTMQLEPFPLWGRYKDVPFFLEWEYPSKAAVERDGATMATKKPKRLRRFVLFAHHPQSLLFLWGPRQYGKAQDLVMHVASRISGVALKEDFYSTFPYTSKAKHVQKVYEAKGILPLPQPLAGSRVAGATRPIGATETAKVALFASEVPSNASSSTILASPASEQHAKSDQPSIPPKEQQKEKTLKRRTRGAAHKAAVWRRLVREPSECGDLHMEVAIWCQRCHENTQVSPKSIYYREGALPLDRKPNWTKGTPAKYIEVKPKCLQCANGRWPWKRFIPVSPEIPSIDMDGLRDWAKKYSFLSTERAIERLAARPSMPRERVVQRKPGFGRIRAARRKREMKPDAVEQNVEA